MKFNIGDRVRVIKILEDGDQLFFNNEDLINKTGKIVVIDDEGYPYGVLFDTPFDDYDEEIFFMERELELV